jgi:hypothetical protein
VASPSPNPQPNPTRIGIMESLVTGAACSVSSEYRLRTPTIPAMAITRGASMSSGEWAWAAFVVIGLLIMLAVLKPGGPEAPENFIKGVLALDAGLLVLAYLLGASGRGR